MTAIHVLQYYNWWWKHAAQIDRGVFSHREPGLFEVRLKLMYPCPTATVSTVWSITYCYIVSALYHCIVTLYYFVIRLFVVMWWYYVTFAPSSQMYTYFCILLCFIRLMWLFWRIAMGLLFLWAWLNILVISRQLINWLIDCIWFYNLCWMKVGFGL